jgi:hypothetical protein
MSEGSFSDVISEHLELQRRNRDLEPAMPLDRYRQEARVDPPLVAADADGDLPTQPVSVHQVLESDPKSWWDAQEGAPPTFNWG